MGAPGRVGDRPRAGRSSDRRSRAGPSGPASGRGRRAGAGRPAAGCGARRRPSPTSARSGASVSLPMRPAHTRSHSAADRVASPTRAADGAGHRLGELAEEPGAPGLEGVEQRLVHLGVVDGLARRKGERRLVGQVERDPAVGAGQRGVPGPEHLAAAGQLVEVRRLVVGDPGREHERLQGRGGHGAARQLVDDRTGPRRRRAARGWCRARRAPRPRGSGRARSARPARPPCAGARASAGGGGAAPRRRTTRCRPRRDGTHRRGRGPGSPAAAGCGARPRCRGRVGRRPRRW